MKSQWEGWPYLVVATQFHQGGLVSKHRTRASAEAHAKHWRGAECKCGCCAVIESKDWDDLPEAQYSTDPYELTR